MFLKSFHIPPAGVFIDGGILIKAFSFCFIDQTGGRNEFDIDLYPLPRIFHLLIRLWDVFGIGKFLSHDTLLFEETVETGDGAFITTLHEFDPENDQSGMRIASAHIPDQFNLVRSMLVWMGMGTSGTVAQGIPGTIVAVFPAGGLFYTFLLL